MSTRLTRRVYSSSDALQAAEESVLSKQLVFDAFVLNDRRRLAALADLGVAEVEEGEALQLYGYQGVTDGPRRP